MAIRSPQPIKGKRLLLLGATIGDGGRPFVSPEVVMLEAQDVLIWRADSLTHRLTLAGSRRPIACRYRQALLVFRSVTGMHRLQIYCAS